MKLNLAIFTAILTALLLLSGTSICSKRFRCQNTIDCSSKRENIHSAIFEVCASDTTNMLAPKVIGKSLAEVKNVQLNKVIEIGTYTTIANSSVHSIL